jgi:hypothetical protein
MAVGFISIIKSPHSLQKNLNFDSKNSKTFWEIMENINFYCKPIFLKKEPCRGIFCRELSRK